MVSLIEPHRRAMIDVDYWYRILSSIQPVGSVSGSVTPIAVGLWRVVRSYIGFIHLGTIVEFISF